MAVDPPHVPPRATVKDRPSSGTATLALGLANELYQYTA
jgi:hypothetical protein